MKLVFTNQYANIFLLINGIAILFYLAAKKKGKQRAMRFGNYETLQKVAGKNFLKSSNIMLITRLMALTILIIGISNPVLIEDVRTADSDYIIALDSSTSMLADDLEPTRFQASKQISSDFASELGNNTKIGVISFSGKAEKHQELSSESEQISSSIESIEIGSTAGTAIGDAISMSSSMLAGNNRPKTVLLITDGRNNAGSTVESGLEMAENNNVTVNTIGIGEVNQSTEDFGTIEGENASRAQFPNLNTTQLSYISDQTGGEFTTATDNTALREALINIEESKSERDISNIFILAAAAILLLEWLLGSTKFSVLP